MLDKRLIPLVIATVSLPLFGWGCNPAQNLMERAIESQTGGKVNVNTQSGTVEIKGENGATVTMGGEEGSVAIPADFPSDVPVYPGSKVMLVFQSKTEGSANLSLTTGDSMDKITTWYADKFKDGWKEESTMNFGDSMIRVYSKNKVRIQLTLGVDKDKNQTTIIVTRVEEKD